MIFEKSSKVAAGINIVPGQERVTPGCPPYVTYKATATAYLRAAQAYMLISMPTGTSTIFGAFQAILALHWVKPDELRPTDKVIQNEKFASKIFFPGGHGCFYVAVRKEFTGLCERASNQ